MSRIMYNGDDGSRFEFEEMGEGKLRVWFKDGITAKEAESFTRYVEIPNIAKVLLGFKEIALGLREDLQQRAAKGA
jgi:hypothetical protein